MSFLSDLGAQDPAFLLDAWKDLSCLTEVEDARKRLPGLG